MKLYQVLYFYSLEPIQQVEIAEMSENGSTRVIDGGMFQYHYWRCFICKLSASVLLCCIHPRFSENHGKCPLLDLKGRFWGNHP